MHRFPAAYFTMLLTGLMVMVLAILPLPGYWLWLRPDFPLLFTAFWVLYRPQLFGVGFGWTVGFMVDAVSGAALGQHALSLSISAYILVVLNQQVRMYSLAQQCTVILVLSFLNLLVAGLMSLVSGYAPNTPLFFLPALTTAMLWPVSFAIGRKQSTRFSRT